MEILVWTYHRATSVNLQRDSLAYNVKMKYLTVLREPVLIEQCARISLDQTISNVSVEMDSKERTVMSQKILAQGTAILAITELCAELYHRVGTPVNVLRAGQEHTVMKTLMTV